MKRMPARSSTPQPLGSPGKAEPKRSARPLQFRLGGLLGLMGVVGIAMAPAYYFVRGQQGEAGSRLAGMLLILAGPLLLVGLVSSVLTLLNWWNRGR
jgi:hypothetical protein